MISRVARPLPSGSSDRAIPDMGVLMSGVLGGLGAAMVVEMGVGGWVMGWGA